MFTQSFKLNGVVARDPFKLIGQSINNLIQIGNSIWLTTGKGLQLSNDNGLNWKMIKTGNVASPLKLFIDSKGWIWISFSSHIMIADKNYPRGNGFAVNRGDGKWIKLAQPKDDKVNFDTTKIKFPITTDVFNLSYDITETIDVNAPEKRKIWIASFAGSLRYIYADSLLDNNWKINWHLKTPDGNILNVAQDTTSGYAQRVFSLASDKQRLWVGTANGIYYSEDHGNTFRSDNFDKTNPSSLSGNFVTKINYFDYHIYAMSRGVSGGQIQALNQALYPIGTRKAVWKKMIEKKQVNDIFVKNNSIFLGTDEGLYLLENKETEWKIFDNFVDIYAQIEITNKAVFALNINRTTWWIGTNEGIAYSTTNGKIWLILKSKFIRKSLKKNNFSSVYPSPFSPTHRRGYLNISFRQRKSGEVFIHIYDFALVEQASIRKHRSASDLATIVWNGKNSSGQYLANGIYFVKIQASNEIFWNKLVILN